MVSQRVIIFEGPRHSRIFGVSKETLADLRIERQRDQREHCWIIHNRDLDDLKFHVEHVLGADVRVERVSE